MNGLCLLNLLTRLVNPVNFHAAVLSWRQVNSASYLTFSPALHRIAMLGICNYTRDWLSYAPL